MPRKKRDDSYSELIDSLKTATGVAGRLLEVFSESEIKELIKSKIISINLPPVGNRHGPRGHKPKGWREQPLEGYGEAYKELCVKILLGTSVYSLAKETGVPEPTMRRIVGGTVPRKDTQRKLIKWAKGNK